MKYNSMQAMPSQTVPLVMVWRKPAPSDRAELTWMAPNCFMPLPSRTSPAEPDSTMRINRTAVFLRRVFVPCMNLGPNAIPDYLRLSEASRPRESSLLCRGEYILESSWDG